MSVGEQGASAGAADAGRVVGAGASGDGERRVASAAPATEAERRAGRILAQMGEALVVVDRDFRILDVNRAAERVLGTARDELIGRSHWDAFPGSVGREPERQYRRVQAEGVEAHFTHHYVDAGRDFHAEVDAYPTDEGGVAIFWRDVTVRMQAETDLRKAAARDAFRVALADALRPLADPAAIQAAASSALGEHLGASRVHYGDIAADDAHVVVEHDYTNGVANLRGRFPMASFCPALIDALRAGRVLVVPDVAASEEMSAAERAAYASVEVGAQVGVPLVARGRLTAVLAVHQSTPREWTPAEVALIVETAERTWYAVERARGEGALRQSEQRFRLMADAVPQIVWITDAEGRTEFFNRQWTAYTGAPYEPTTAAAVAQRFVHPDDGAATMAAFEHARRTGGIFSVEHRIRSAAGDHRWFLVRAQPAHDPSTGEIVRWFGASVDIHDRRLAEAERERLLRALELERLRLAAVFAQTPSVLAIVRGTEHVLEMANEAYLALNGYRDVLGKPLLEAVPELRGQGFEQLLDGVVATGEPYIGREVPIWLSKSSGSQPEERFFDFVYLPLVEADSTGARQRVGVIAHGNDITEQVRARREVERLLGESERAHADAEAARRDAEAARAEAEVARRAAEGANRAKSEFLAVMSHELRTPLNAIGGYAELMEMGIRGPVTDQQRTDLGRIQQSQRHLLGLVNEVLNYAKLESGAVRYDLIDLPACEALAAAEALVAPQARARGLALTVAACPADLVVRADPEKLRQVLVNLLSNATKFTEPGAVDGAGRIEISCTTEGTTVAFRVRDTGIGIPAEKLAEIFDPFVQVRTDLTRPHDGAGLGLAISRDLARGMGGDLTVESSPGVGSTFSLTLPRPQ